MTGRVICLKPGCNCSWERDPALEVACPDCKARVGSKCRRPSGHTTWQGEVHSARDLLADKLGHYGACPSGRCGLNREMPVAPAAQLSLFEARP
jgi:hypothetical protein